MASRSKKVRVIELFAGVGGFRLGLEGWKGKSPLSGYKKSMPKNFEVVWSNQHEPGRRVQYANAIYNFHFGNIENSIHSEDLIEDVNPNTIPHHEMIVGGFPCQDFSVGALNKFSDGLKGKKGALWFSIRNILKFNINHSSPTKYVLLENVDRLLKCPVDLKGADFTTILENFNELNYAVEWKIINAGDYNMPQRRRRVFIIAYHKSTKIYRAINDSPKEWITKAGTMSSSFNSIDYTKPKAHIFDLSFARAHIKSRPSTSDSTSDKHKYSNYIANKKIPSLFANCGIMIDGRIVTMKHYPDKEINKNPISKYLEKNESKISKDFIITNKEYEEKWAPTRKSKTIEREVSSSYTYKWKEGSMPPFDDERKPARTIITSEGGRSASRTKHIIRYKNAYRRLIPSELDQLSMFPKNYTKYGKKEESERTIKIADSRRAFMIGNALVVGVVERIGKELYRLIDFYGD